MSDCLVCKRSHGMAMTHTPLEYAKAENADLKQQLAQVTQDNKALAEHHAQEYRKLWGDYNASYNAMKADRDALQARLDARKGVTNGRLTTTME